MFSHLSLKNYINPSIEKQLIELINFIKKEKEN